MHSTRFCERGWRHAPLELSAVGSCWWPQLARPDRVGLWAQGHAHWTALLQVTHAELLFHWYRR
jgi:hypothetical protein